MSLDRTQNIIISTIKNYTIFLLVNFSSTKYHDNTFIILSAFSAKFLWELDGWMWGKKKGESTAGKHKMSGNLRVQINTQSWKYFRSYMLTVSTKILPRAEKQVFFSAQCKA